MEIYTGAPERSRTPNLQIRSLTLYPIELRAPYVYKIGKNPPLSNSFPHATMKNHTKTNLGAKDLLDPLLQLEPSC